MVLFFLLQWVFVALRRLSLVTESRGYSLLWGTASVGAWCQQLQLIGLVSLWHVKSSQTKDGTRVPCIGRQILIHCATREVPTWCSWLGFSWRGVERTNAKPWKSVTSGSMRWNVEIRLHSVSEFNPENKYGGNHGRGGKFSRIERYGLYSHPPKGAYYSTLSIWAQTSSLPSRCVPSVKMGTTELHALNICCGCILTKLILGN